MMPSVPGNLIGNFERDYYGGCNQQVEKIRAGQNFDRENVASEIENIGRYYDRFFIREALLDLVEMLLLTDPSQRHYFVWRSRDEILDALKRSPSLIPRMPELI